MMRPSSLPVALLAVTLSLACASTGPRPGTGDVSFRLVWSGATDLDLYVLSPAGERVDFVFREVESGGRLDVDCNVRPTEVTPDGESPLVLCEEPMENIFWPRGRAPHGTYRYWTVLANPEGLQAVDEFRLEVRSGQRVVRRHRGRVEELRAGEVGGEIDWPGGERPEAERAGSTR